MRTATGLQAALLLARGRAEGLAQVDTDAAAAWRSFLAMPVAVPAALAITLAGWRDGGPADPWHDLAIELLIFVIGWVGYILLSRELATAIGRGGAWHRFVIVWNWCQVVQYGLMLVALVPPLLGGPDWLADATWIVAACWAIWLEWLATRLTLNLSGFSAACFVLLDLAIGLVLGAFTA